jgi:putative ABC transport system substrate-binding protein
VSLRSQAAAVGAAAVLLLGAAWAVPVRASAPHVVILVTGGAAAYREAERGARAVLDAVPGVATETVVLDGPDGDSAARRAVERDPALVVAIGSRAARLAREQATGRPLVYAMVLDPASLGLPTPDRPQTDSATGVTMHVAAARQFELLRELAPGVKRIGVLYDPAISGDEVRGAEAAARAAGLRLVPQPVRSEGETLGAARLLAPQVDALWAVADPTVLTASNARALILFALRARLPLLAMSEGYVRTGALAALAAAPDDVGRRAGELARSILAGAEPGELPPESPPRLALFLNRATAGHLGLDLPAALLDQAQQVYPP